MYFKCNRPKLIDAFNIYITGIDNGNYTTEITIKVIEMAGYYRYRNYQKHIDYMVDAI